MINRNPKYFLDERISGTDLNTLLLEVFREKSNRSSASDLFKRYQENRFVHLATVDPIQLKQLELDVSNRDDFVRICTTHKHVRNSLYFDSIEKQTLMPITYEVKYVAVFNSIKIKR